MKRCVTWKLKSARLSVSVLEMFLLLDKKLHQLVKAVVPTLMLHVKSLRSHVMNHSGFLPNNTPLDQNMKNKYRIEELFSTSIFF